MNQNDKIIDHIKVSSNSNINIENNSIIKKKYCCPCSPKQLVLLIIPFVLIGLYLAIFLPIFLSKEKEVFKIEYIDENNTINNNTNEFDEFEEYVSNYSYATLTPINCYKNIYIHLGNIYETANTYFYFFKSESTIIPKNTKIIFLNGKKRKVKYMEKFNNDELISSWFNFDYNGNLICNKCNNIYDEAKESLYYILDKIDQIKNEEKKIDYNKIFLGGYGQGGTMVNYILLNSRHELGGYCSFSGYFFEHHFPENNSVVNNLTDIQKEILESKKNYNIIASFPFNDDIIKYSKVVNLYSHYFKYYTNFQFFSFRNSGFITMPILSVIKRWLKEKMEK